MWWHFLKPGRDDQTRDFNDIATASEKWMSPLLQGSRVFREKRALFPLPNYWEDELAVIPMNLELGELLDEMRSVPDVSVFCWCALCTYFCNHLHEDHWCFQIEAPTKAQLPFLKSIEENVRKVLKEDKRFKWEDDDIEEDLKSKMLSYNGEEASSPEILTTSQVIPGLPPSSHGGSVPLREWLNGKCQWYLDHPRECLVEDVGQPLPRLAAKVHIAEGERMSLAKLLVERRICRWIPENRVLRFRNEKVLNGMFGVRKSGTASCGRPILRLIMNMIPSNSLHITISGRVTKLPNICAWSHTVCDEDELVTVCQSDMAAAFYLFALPESWSEQLCFNLSFTNRELGVEDRPAEERQYLSCAVLPMGWSSAVGVMQFVAEEVLFRNGLPKEAQVRGGAPLPPWVADSRSGGGLPGKIWWHVYLDNYASGEKHRWDEDLQGGMWQQSVEDWWEDAGITCSKHKSTVNVQSATELGAFISGTGKWMGASCERMVKVAKTSLWLVSKTWMRKKQVQIVMGRWIFITQFRRPAMAQFQKVWELISEERWSKGREEEARREILGAILGLCLYHVSFDNQIEDCISCSDASTKGGAVAYSTTLSNDGKWFMKCQKDGGQATKVPIYVISLFNGIGAAFRCYDLNGVIVRGGLAVDIHKPGMRVTSRRWPWVNHWEDVRTLDRSALEELLSQEDFLCIDVWAGFPCVDLSAVKWNRQNLEGTQSSLIHEAIRVIETLRELFLHCRVRYIVENVASMDISARDEISSLLGVKPYRVDPRRQVPMSRPRLCWTDVELWAVEDLSIVDKGSYFELEVESCWPQPRQWLSPGSSQVDEDTIYPTCMKSIRRSVPPPQPAGIGRCDSGTLSRWESEQFKFPPYQFKAGYLIWDDNLGSHRLIDVEEREQLMGLGLRHTEVCLSASESKQSKQRSNAPLAGRVPLRLRRSAS
eukprot:Skav208366  [mRNA]  locus=scaffold1964:533664:536637:- [translate_table: standard]